MPNVANQAVDDGGASSNKMMGSAQSPGTSKGMCECFLGGPTAQGRGSKAGSITAGTMAGENKAAGTGFPMATAGSIGAGFMGGPTPDTLVSKSMSVGQSPGTKIGMHKGWL